MAVEYVFYLFFGLCLLCILAVLAAEQLRVAGRQQTATLTEHGTRMLFLLAMVGTVVAALLASSLW